MSEDFVVDVYGVPATLTALDPNNAHFMSYPGTAGCHFYLYGSYIQPGFRIDVTAGAIIEPGYGGHYVGGYFDLPDVAGDVLFTVVNPPDVPGDPELVSNPMTFTVKSGTPVDPASDEIPPPNPPPPNPPPPQGWFA
jgi:hypothetical protein